MPASTINRLLERIVQLPLNDELLAAEQIRHEMARFRHERETTAGPLSEQQWRGVLLSAIDLLETGSPDHLVIRQALTAAIHRLAEDNAA